MTWPETGASEAVFGLGRAGVFESSGSQGGSEARGLEAGCLLWGRESSWTGLRCWRGTAGEGNFEAGLEVEEVVEGLVQGMTEE